MVRKLCIAACIAVTALAYGGTQTHAAKVGEMCGGIGGIRCDRGLWCDPAPGRCGMTDVEGVCIKVPQTCPKAKVGTKDFLPVCGCKKRQFGNDCERRMHKWPKDHDGPC
jgi:hypothetical protein